MEETTRIEVMFWRIGNERELEERLAQIKQALPTSDLVWQQEDRAGQIVWADFEVPTEAVTDWIRGFNGFEWSSDASIQPQDDFELEDEFIGG